VTRGEANAPLCVAGPASALGPGHGSVRHVM